MWPPLPAGIDNRNIYFFRDQAVTFGYKLGSMMMPNKTVAIYLVTHVTPTGRSVSDMQQLDTHHLYIHFVALLTTVFAHV